jgi:ATP-dependent Clp protease adapter protein ClpS
MFDAQTLINVGLAAILAAVGWFARQLWEAVQRLQRDLHEVEVSLPTSYVSKNDFNTTMKHIEDMFQRIYDKLDEKADKP